MSQQEDEPTLTTSPTTTSKVHPLLMSPPKSPSQDPARIRAQASYINATENRISNTPSTIISQNDGILAGEEICRIRTMEHVLKTIESNEYIRGVKERNVWFDDLLIRLMENKVRGRQHVIWQHISRVNTRREREDAHYVL